MTQKIIIIKKLQSLDDPISPISLGKLVNINPGSVKLVLWDLLKQNKVQRIGGIGPRGGYGYHWNWPDYIRRWKRKLIARW